MHPTLRATIVAAFLILHLVLVGGDAAEYDEITRRD